jgi:hypothetical protein
MPIVKLLRNGQLTLPAEIVKALTERCISSLTFRGANAA